MLELPPEIVVYDTEYTAWEGSKARNWTNPGEYREIVNIGAVRVETEKFTELSFFNIFIKPTKNPILSDYFTNLTNITQAQIEEEGVEFPLAVKQYLLWCRNTPMYCYGVDDQIIKANCELVGIEFPFAQDNCRDIRKIFSQAGITAENYTSSTIIRAFGEEPSRPAHTGLDDSRTIVEGLKLLAKNNT